MSLLSLPMNCPDCGDLTPPISTTFAEPELKNPKSDHFECGKCGFKWDYTYKAYRGLLTDALNNLGEWWDEE